MKDKVLYYTQNVCDSFTSRFEELGGNHRQGRDLHAGRQDDQQRRQRRRTATKADAIAICTVTQQRPAGVRLGAAQPRQRHADHVPWSADGTYWLPRARRCRTSTFVTFASVYGDDPNADVRALIEEMFAKKKAPTTGRLHHRRVGGRRPGACDAGGGLDRRRGGRGRAAEAEQVPDDTRQDQLLGQVPHGVRTHVPRDPDHQRQGEGASAASRRRRSSPTSADARGGEQPRLEPDGPEELLRAVAVSRSFEACARSRTSTLELGGTRWSG